MLKHTFRFGVVAGQSRTADEWVAKARRAESLGFSTCLVPDTLGQTFAPLSALYEACLPRFSRYNSTDTVEHVHSVSCAMPTRGRHEYLFASSTAVVRACQEITLTDS